ncbi:MAG TPA: hypothetical protein VNA88_12590 [Candidatus Kapabacteria bacterium]|jgi:hypothetical protein|nr:hypothetical protein [Candidatus Kapabacteria bacterium]
MKRSTTRALIALALIASTVGGYGCAALSQIGNLRNLQFQLGAVQGFRLNGVDISRISQPSDVSPMDMVRLGQAIATKTMPVEFTLNVNARNPNTPTAGAQPTPLYLSRLDWRLKIDGRETIAGVVNRQLEIPAGGQTTVIPLTMQLDLYKFFADRGLNDMINLATAIGGARGSSSRLELLAKVQVTIPGIPTPINYPGEISIVDRQFSN